MPTPQENGIVATSEELVRLRKHAGTTGIAPRGRVRTAQSGHYDSAFRGRGMEFDESRAYQPGDDVRTIDWRVSARTGRVHTKLFHEERERPVLLLLDERPSMRFGTRGSFKSVLAARAAAALAWTARDAGDRVGAMVLTGSGRIEVPPRRSEARLLHLLRLVSASTAESRVDAVPRLAEGLARLARVSRPGTLAFVLSDFHDLDDETERELGHLARRADVGAIFVYDALEEAFPVRAGLRLSDGAGERVLGLDAEDSAVRSEWHERFASHRARLESLCRRRGIAFLPLRTGEPEDRALGDRFGVELRRAARTGRGARA